MGFCLYTGMCITPGRFYWFTCNVVTPNLLRASRGAPKEAVFRHPFIARRVQDGRLTLESAEEEWNNYVGYPYADEATFYDFLTAIIRHDAGNQTEVYNEDFLYENPAARLSAAGPPAADAPAVVSPPAAELSAESPAAEPPAAAGPPAASAPAVVCPPAADPPAESPAAGPPAASPAPSLGVSEALNALSARVAALESPAVGCQRP